MKYLNHESYIEIYPPVEFSFDECLLFLERSNQEVLHQIKEDFLYKLIRLDNSLTMLKIGYSNESIKVEFPIENPSKHSRKLVAEYVSEWFDLEKNLSEFYQMASQDQVLEGITQQFYGLRIIGIPDLFEALVWAIIGQQINLTFAYTLKKRFVEQFGESLIFEGETFWLFPSFEKIAAISVDDLRELQFSVRKAEYIIGIAQTMKNGGLTKELLLQKHDYQEVKKILMSIRGVGAWTADYVMMKCLHDTSSFPIADVGLHNALKNLLHLEKKPTIEEIEQLAENWIGWQAYATFYLWRSLYDEIT